MSTVTHTQKIFSSGFNPEKKKDARDYSGTLTLQPKFWGERNQAHPEDLDHLLSCQF